MPDDSMADAGIFSGDVLIVDLLVKPLHDHIMLAILDGVHMIRQLYKRGREIRLVSNCPDIELREGQELQIVGVVTVCIRQLL